MSYTECVIRLLRERQLLRQRISSSASTLLMQVRTPTEPVVPSPAPDTDGVESSEATEFTIEPEDALSMIILDSPAEEEVFESAPEIADTTDLADSVEETSVPIVELPEMADLEEEAEPAIVDPPSAAEPPCY